MDQTELITTAADNNPFSPGGEHERMHQIVLAASICQTVRCAALFLIAEHLADGPRTAEEIACLEGLNVTGDVAWAVAHTIRGAQLVWFEKSGHLPYYEEPEKYATTVNAFLTRTDTRQYDNVRP